jgi:GNAT superfamily N-acetyltransferase
MKIRKAGSSDAMAVAAILKEVGWFKAANQAEMAALATRVGEVIEATLEDKWNLTLVAEEDAGPVTAFICAHTAPVLFLSGPELYISSLYVREKSRGLGVGGALLEAMREYAAQTGCARLTLLNSIERDSSRRGFFEKHGFVKRSKINNYILRLT